MKTSELIGPALDWAVAKCEFKDELKISPNGYITVGHDARFAFCPSTDWAQGGPIIERESISVQPSNEWPLKWIASKGRRVAGPSFYQYGNTPLIAAMRCYCCAVLGDEIDIPEELMKG